MKEIDYLTTSDLVQNRKQTILVADDDRSIRNMISIMLRSSNYEVYEAADGEIALQVLKEKQSEIDLIILDIMMPNVDGMEVCDQIKNKMKLKEIYIILLTAKTMLDDKIKGLKIGADDYLCKPFARAELLARVEAAFRQIEIRKELKIKNMLIREEAKHDKLTGIYNRNFFDSVMEYETSRAKRYKEHLTIIVVDIDHFSNYNNTYGHHVGDEVLKRVAQLMDENTRETDIVARWGGEEFVIILPSIDLAGGVRVAEKIRKIIETDKKLADNNIPNVTISAGVASFFEHKCDNEYELFERADEALMQLAKKRGRNRVEFLQLPEE